MAPDKIYIQPNARDGWFEGDKPNDNFVEYICKDALLEWAKARKAGLSSGESFVAGERKMLKEIIDKIETL